VAAAIVTSRLGVLVGRRRDGDPPWTFPAGKIEPGEGPEDAVVRETWEETGLRIRAGGVIGSIHPLTGRWIVYVAAAPADESAVSIDGAEELAAVRWVSLAEADELMGDMFGAVRQHLQRTLGG
jgi:8-oxo-dGTP pyrophosphatase MutT (NUDIX family)